MTSYKMTETIPMSKDPSELFAIRVLAKYETVLHACESCGAADYYYYRSYKPHFTLQKCRDEFGTIVYENRGYGFEVTEENMTLTEIDAYKDGYEEAEAIGDRKIWD